VDDALEFLELLVLLLLLELAGEVEDREALHVKLEDQEAAADARLVLVRHSLRDAAVLCDEQLVGLRGELVPDRVARMRRPRVDRQQEDFEVGYRVLVVVGIDEDVDLEGGSEEVVMDEDEV